MATSEFTEFSFGYALTDSLIGALLAPLGSAPKFPSLIQEGQLGGGYDVELPSVPYPLFLQFKIQQVMVKASSLMPPGYAPVYYRMPLRTKAPNQHQLMLTLESSKPDALVLYATPLIHRVVDLDRHFLDKTVHQATAYISPSAIGSLDNKSHHVSYRPGNATYWRHSEPEPIGSAFTFDSLLMQIGDAGAHARERFQVGSLVPSADAIGAIQREAVQSTAEWFRKRIVAARTKNIADELLEFEKPNYRLLAARLAYVAQVHFGLTLAWLDASPAPAPAQPQG